MERLGRTAEVGAQHAIFSVRDVDDLSKLELIGRDVIPQLRDLGEPSPHQLITARAVTQPTRSLTGYSPGVSSKHATMTTMNDNEAGFGGLQIIDDGERRSAAPIAPIAPIAMEQPADGRARRPRPAPPVRTRACSSSAAARPA